MDEFLEIIKKFKLEYYLNVILTNNNGNTNLYHNFYHTQCVTTNCYKIAIDTDTYEENDIKILLIAALFHDFNHSGGKLKNDSENVKLAIEGFQKYTKESKEDTEFICDLIKITEFPYNADNDSKLSIRQQILRDADVMQWLEPNFI
jgi:HD superfamily phosphodiesterase